MQTLKKLLTLTFMLLALSSTAKAEQNYKNLFVTITSSEIKKSGMGLAIANAFTGAGVKTTVLIGADASAFVATKGSQNMFGPTGKTPKAMIEMIIKKGGKVMICGMCAKFSDMKQGELIKNVTIATPGDVAAALLAPSTQTLSF